MWTWELQTEMDGTQCLRVTISPETPLTEAASMLLKLTRLLLFMEDLEAQHDGDSPPDSGSNDFWSGRMSQAPWDFPNWN